MVYIKFTQKQLKTLQKLPSNLNTSMTSHNIGGVLVLTKSQEIKQIILDFQAYHIDELYTSRKDKKVHLSEHIKAVDPKYNYTLTFEIENILKKQEHKVEFSCFSIPDIFQWIKKNGNLTDMDMYRIFNCGIGMVLIIDQEFSDDINQEIKKCGYKSFNIGRVINKEKDSVIYS